MWSDARDYHVGVLVHMREYMTFNLKWMDVSGIL